MRGVDSIAIVGNGGSSDNPEDGDGAVHVTSASLGFLRTASDEQTRVLPYCHVDPDVINQYIVVNVILNDRCSTLHPVGIADVDSPSHESWPIISSFLADKSNWKTVGVPPNQDVYLSNQLGVLFGVHDANDNSEILASVGVNGNANLTLLPDC